MMIILFKKKQNIKPNMKMKNYEDEETDEHDKN